MGREWLYKATGGGGDGRKSTGKGVNSKKAKYKNPWSSGCMSAIYNLFDIQHQQLRFHHPSFMPSDNIHLTSFSLHQGIEAPRNSLESSESEAKEHTNLNIPVGRMKIKTSRLNFSDEACISPGTKTPNLVARLMGLDILPEYSSPRPSSSDHLSRSLPATPRLSTASRKSSDNVIHHHRLSLQIDKENYNICKERSGRRLGTDITNTVSETRSIYQRRDLNLVKDPVRKAKVRLLEIKENLNKPEEVKVKSKQMKKKVVKDEKIKRVVSERYDLRLKKMKQQEKVSVVNNNKNTNKSSTKHKKEMIIRSSCSNTTKLSQKQVSLPSNYNSSYNSNDTHNLKPAAATTSTAVDSYSFTGLSRRSMGWLSSTALKAEVEGIVVEIEREIMKSLVHEIATC